MTVTLIRAGRDSCPVPRPVSDHCICRPEAKGGKGIRNNNVRNLLKITLRIYFKIALLEFNSI